MPVKRQLLPLFIAVALVGCASTATPTAQRQPARRRATGPEVVLAVNADQPGQTLRNQLVSATAWCAEVIKPDFATIAPGETVLTYTVTSVKFRPGKNVGALGATPWTLYLRHTDAAHKPAPGTDAANTYDKTTIAAAALPPTSTQPPYMTVDFTGGAAIPADHDFAFVVGPGNFSPGGAVGTASGGVQNPPDMALDSSTSSGGIWLAPSATYDMLIEVRGTYTTP